MKKTILSIILAVIIIAGGIFLFMSNQNKIVIPPIEEEIKQNTITDQSTENNGEIDGKEVEEIEKVDWKDVSFTNIQNDETFSINEFSGKQVLLETFAVWCPTCTKQQRQLEEYHINNPDVVTIAMNVDPNEDKSFVLEHIKKNEFYSSPYVISSVEVTQQLMAEFGSQIISVSSAPVIHICPDGTANLLGRGVKKADDFDEALASC